MLVLASQNSFEVMCAVEDGTIEPPEEIIFGFGDCQDKLNKIIQKPRHASRLVDTGLEVSERLVALVRETQKHRRDI